MMLWYLGDGSLIFNGSAYFIHLATCSFSTEEINAILRPKLLELGIESSVNSDNKICIYGKSIRRFFEVIGNKSPVPEYQYKFDIPEWLGLLRLSDIVKNDREKWRAQYYYKTGQIECSKSPGGSMLLFTEEQAHNLKNKLSS